MRRTAVVLVCLVLALASACGDDDDGEAGSADAGGTVTVTIADFAFEPKTVEVAAGATLEITNEDDAPHTFTLDDGSYDSGRIDAGDSVRHEVEESGEVGFHCTLHPSMTGTLRVE
jgi:plastocyanin